MGGDGGTKAVSRRFMQGAKADNASKKREVDEKQSTSDKATCCAYSGKELEAPVVVCKIGFLYNKEDIYRALLDKSLFGFPEFEHIKRTRDLKPALLTSNPLYSQKATSTNSFSKEMKSVSKFICPITQLELNGLNPFVVLSSSGQVVSLKAVKELPNLLDGQSYMQLFPNDVEAKLRRDKLKSTEGSLLSKKRNIEKTDKSKKKKKKVFSGVDVGKVLMKAEEEFEGKKKLSETYSKLFDVKGEDHTKDGQDKNMMFMIGNPRGFVHC